MRLLKFFNTSIDMFFIQGGQENCEPGYSNQIYLERGYILHFVFKGKGYYKLGSKVYNIKKGDAFLIPANVHTYYRADMTDPWHYMWFQISGETAKKFFDSVNLSAISPVYHTTDIEKVVAQFENLLSVFDEGNECIYVAELLKLMGIMEQTSLIKTAPKPMSANEYVNMCVTYINANYRNKITVDELCEIANIERSYLFRIFKNQIGISPQKYIIQCKMKTAANLLAIGEFTVAETAKSVGYDDQFAFSKLFKRQFGISPLEYKNRSDIWQSK